MFGGFIAESREFDLTGVHQGTDVWIPEVGHRIVLTGVQFTVSAASEVDLRFESVSEDSEGLGYVESQPIKLGDFAANGGVDTQFRWPMVGGENQYIGVSNTAGNIKGVLHGWEEPVR